MEFTLITTLIYLVFQMETVGDMYLGIMFQQFNFEMINDSFHERRKIF